MGVGSNFNLALLLIGATAVVLLTHYKVQPKLTAEFRFKEFFIVVLVFNLTRLMYMSKHPDDFAVVTSIFESIGFFFLVYSVALWLEEVVRNYLHDPIPSTHQICHCDCLCCVGEHNIIEMQE